MTEPLLTLSDSATEATDKLNPQPAVRQRAWARFRRNRPAVWSFWVLSVILVVLLAWPLVLKLSAMTGPSGAHFAQRFQPDQVSDAQFQAPSVRHWFGTDVHGRDLFSRVIAGAQVSLLVGCIAAGLSLFIGVFWGALAGYAGGRTDSLLMRAVDVLYSLPSIILLLS